MKDQHSMLNDAALETVSGGLQAQGDLKGALEKLEKEIKNREKSLNK